VFEVKVILIFDGAAPSFLRRFDNQAPVAAVEVPAPLRAIGYGALTLNLIDDDGSHYYDAQKLLGGARRGVRGLRAVAPGVEV
jgi:hypothetical protein